jgi:hypothetical protein
MHLALGNGAAADYKAWPVVNNFEDWQIPHVSFRIPLRNA